MRIIHQYLAQTVSAPPPANQTGIEINILLEKGLLNRFIRIGTVGPNNHRTIEMRARPRLGANQLDNGT